MNELKLVLKRVWYDMIASGEKKEEYRDITPYWAKRFRNIVGIRSDVDGVFYPILAKVTFYLGYVKNRPSMTFEIDSITIGQGKPEWGAEPGKLYFVTKIGYRYEKDEKDTDTD